MTSTETYQAQIDDWGLSEDTMTTGGIPVRDTHPIKDCILTPGDPSPCGRTEHGDLVYPVHPTKTHFGIERHRIAWLAHLTARELGITQVPTLPCRTPDAAFLMELLNEALPHELFDDSAHDRLARQNGLDAILSGHFDKLPTWLTKGNSDR